MKIPVSIFLFYFLFLFGCNSQKQIQETNKLSNKEPFTLIKASVQNSIPGIDDGGNTYLQHWIIYLNGPANQSADLLFFLNGYSIKLNDLGSKGVKIGSDNKDFAIKFDVLYPMDKNYTKVEGDIGNKPQLQIKTEEYTQILQVDSIEILEGIIYPSNMN